MNKKAIITGASRGIGKSIATLLAARQYDLYLVCHNNTSLLFALCQDLSAEYGIQCQSFTGDIGNPDFVRQLFSSIPDYDVLINNAGVSHIGLLHDMSDNDWQNVMNVNLNSLFYTCRQAIPHFLSKQKGKIINISSVWGSVGASMEVAYSTSKGGVNAFTKALAKELAPSNISVNAIACGFIDTKMNQHLTQAEVQALINEIPADRAGTPLDVAQMVLSLMDSPSYLTGQIITLDGGWT